MHPKDRERDRNDDDSALGAEAVDQLHHLDDRRDSAQMRIEELVRDAEFDESGDDSGADRGEQRGDASDAGERHVLTSPPVHRGWLWLAAAAVAAILYALSRLLPT